MKPSYLILGCILIVLLAVMPGTGIHCKDPYYYPEQ